MYHADVEAVENANEDFLSALALLRSSDEDSAEKLGSMLFALMEKKTDDKSDNCPAKLAGIVSQFQDGTDRSPEDCTSSGESIDLSPSEIRTIDESHEDEDIPRISIPDETTGDGVVCKICNGDKLGPLILLECQECQDVYHPLCHHPPVVDIDVYDPRIVWRCERCIETGDDQAEPFVPSLDDGFHASGEKTEVTGSRGDAMPEPFVESTGYDKKELGRNEATQMSCFGKTRLRLANHGSSLKRTSGVTYKNSSIKSKKRIGSRLGVARLSSAK